MNTPSYFKIRLASHAKDKGFLSQLLKGVLMLLHFSVKDGNATVVKVELTQDFPVSANTVACWTPKHQLRHATQTCACERGMVMLAAQFEAFFAVSLGWTQGVWQSRQQMPPK